MLNYLINQAAGSSWILSINSYRPSRLRSWDSKSCRDMGFSPPVFFPQGWQSTFWEDGKEKFWANQAIKLYNCIQLWTKTSFSPFFFFRKVYTFWSLDILTLDTNIKAFTWYTWAEIMCNPTRIWLNWFLRPLTVFQTPHLIHLTLPAARLQRDYGFAPATSNWFRMREV